jgi:hypothetical protein
VPRAAQHSFVAEAITGAEDEQQPKGIVAQSASRTIALRAKRSPARAARGSASAYARAGHRPDAITPAGKPRAFRISAVDRLRHGREGAREIYPAGRASGPLGCVHRARS